MRSLPCQGRFIHVVACCLVICWAAGCKPPEPFGLYLGPYEDLPNHVQPYKVAVDPAARLAFSTSLGNHTVAVYDMDERLMVSSLPVDSTAVEYPSIVVDENGVVWVLGRSAPPLTRFDVAAGTRSYPVSPLERIGSGRPMPGGGLLALGFKEDNEQVMIRFDADGEQLRARAPAGPAADLVSMADGGAALLLGDPLHTGLQILDLDTLETSATCVLPFNALTGAQLEDGTFVVSNHNRIGLAGCDGEPAVSWQVGIENASVISLGDGAVVLDRMGLTEGFDPKFGVAWEVDATGVHPDGFPTAKNTGYGAYDPQTGLVWANSEGTTEVAVISVDERQVVDTVRSGTFLDGLVADGTLEDTYFVTGRLSNTFLRITGTEVTAETDEVFWPFSPQIDDDRDRVWVLSQTDSTVHGHARDDLSSQQVIDPGLGPNHLLTFGSIALHHDRGTLLQADSQRDVMLELDMDTGEELGRWELGGPPITDRDAVGQLLIVVNQHDDGVIVARSNDARVQRIELDSPSVTTAWLGDDVSAALADNNAIDFAHPLPLEGLLYVGGFAVDTNTCERVTDRDLDVSRVIGPHPQEEDQLLAVASDRRNLVRVDLEGNTLGSVPYALRDLNASVYRVGANPATISMVRAHDAHFLVFDLELLE